MSRKTTVTTSYEVWDGMGTHHLTTANYDQAAKLVDELRDRNLWARAIATLTWPCHKCGKTVTTDGGRDTACYDCGAQYNGSGQRLRDNWQSNRSLYDEDVSDLEGFEEACLRSEQGV